MTQWLNRHLEVAMDPRPDMGFPPEVRRARQLQRSIRQTDASLHRREQQIDRLFEQEGEHLLPEVTRILQSLRAKVARHREDLAQVAKEAARSTTAIEAQEPPPLPFPQLPSSQLRPDGRPWWPRLPPAAPPPVAVAPPSPGPSVGHSAARR